MFYFKQYKRACIVLVMVAFSVLFIGCGRGMFPPEWGERLKYEGSDLFYTSAITESEARKLGDYLLESGFFQKDNTVTTQITKEGDVYLFRMVVKGDKGEDMEFLEKVGIFAAQLSRYVFDGKQVGIHLCDKQFKTTETVTFLIEEDSQE